MKGIFFILASFIVLSCSSKVMTDASKKTDLKSPCAGCDDRVFPSGNAKYLV